MQYDPDEIVAVRFTSTAEIYNQKLDHLFSVKDKVNCRGRFRVHPWMDNSVPLKKGDRAVWFYNRTELVVIPSQRYYVKADKEGTRYVGVCLFYFVSPEYGPFAVSRVYPERIKLDMRYEHFIVEG